MRIATYHRVSTVDQDPTLAREELRAAAERLGDLTLEVEETGSGARNDRPGLQRLMEAVRKGGLDVVVVWKLDRFGRSALDVLGNIRELEGRGARFICTSQGLDVRPGGDAMSRLMLTVLAAVAEFERDLIRERTIVGMARVAQEEADPRTRAARRNRSEEKGGPKLAIGRKPKLPPEGFERVKQLRAEGKSWSQVAKELDVSIWVAMRAARKEAA